jgi:hypothetical protein
MSAQRTRALDWLTLDGWQHCCYMFTKVNTIICYESKLHKDIIYNKYKSNKIIDICEISCKKSLTKSLNGKKIVKIL